jgi:hypothetical protein
MEGKEEINISASGKFEFIKSEGTTCYFLNSENVITVELDLESQKNLVVGNFYELEYDSVIK